MDPDQRLLDEYIAREEARAVQEWRQKKAAKLRCETAAKEAHKTRRAMCLLLNRQMPAWDELSGSDQYRATLEAEAVALNPSICDSELWELYRKAHPYEPDPDETTKSIEAAVLEALKKELRA